MEASSWLLIRKQRGGPGTQVRQNSAGTSGWRLATGALAQGFASVVKRGARAGVFLKVFSGMGSMELWNLLLQHWPNGTDEE